MDPVSSAPRAKVHPLVIAASISIILLSGVGIATLLNNRSAAQTASSPALAVASATPAPASAAGSADTVAPPPPGFNNTAAVPPAPDTPPAQFAPASNAAALGTPASAPADAGASAQAAPIAPCGDCVTVTAMRPIAVRGESTGLGAVGGGIAGGLIGHSIGNGRGNVALTLLGAAGGAVAGNAIEKNARSRTEYQLVVRYPSGRERYFTHLEPWPYNVGDTVRIVNGKVVALR